MTRTTPDVLALRILMSTDSKAVRDAKLAKLGTQVRNAIENRVECPDCGSMGPHEDNGCTGSQRAYLCSSCHNQFDAE